MPAGRKDINQQVNEQGARDEVEHDRCNDHVASAFRLKPAGNGGPARAEQCGCENGGGQGDDPAANEHQRRNGRANAAEHGLALAQC